MKKTPKNWQKSQRKCSGEEAKPCAKWRQYEQSQHRQAAEHRKQTTDHHSSRVTAGRQLLWRWCAWSCWGSWLSLSYSRNSPTYRRTSDRVHLALARATPSGHGHGKMNSSHDCTLRLPIEQDDKMVCFFGSVKAKLVDYFFNGSLFVFGVVLPRNRLWIALTLRRFPLTFKMLTHRTVITSLTLCFWVNSITVTRLWSLCCFQQYLGKEFSWSCSHLEIGERKNLEIRFGEVLLDKKLE